jgi:hypothetical protein
MYIFSGRIIYTFPSLTCNICLDVYLCVYVCTLCSLDGSVLLVNTRTGVPAFPCVLCAVARQAKRERMAQRYVSRYSTPSSPAAETLHPRCTRHKILRVAYLHIENAVPTIAFRSICVYFLLAEVIVISFYDGIGSQTKCRGNQKEVGSIPQGG